MTKLSSPNSTPANSPVGDRLIPLGVCAAAVAVWLVATVAAIQISVWHTPRPAPALNAGLAERPAKPVIELALANHGREVFNTTCAQCHDLSGQGRAGLGKDLVRSEFVADLTDEALVTFIERGRPVNDPLNTTKIPMPPKGGAASLTQDDLNAVVAYVRALQDPRRMPAMQAWTSTSPTAPDASATLAAAGGDPELAKYIANGNTLFHSLCVACHGKAGAGMPGNGKRLAENDFIRSLSDDALLDFVKQGRAPTDPKNTTGIQMPPKGGNPALSDDDILDIIAYLRTLQSQKSASLPGN